MKGLPRTWSRKSLDGGLAHVREGVRKGSSKPLHFQPFGYVVGEHRCRERSTCKGPEEGKTGLCFENGQNLAIVPMSVQT